MKIASAVLFLLSAVVGTTWGNTVEYTVVDLGPGIATGINDAGQVVGYSGNPYHAFLYTGGAMTNLGTLAAPNNYDSAAEGISASGRVVDIQARLASVATPSFTPAGPCRTSGRWVDPGAKPLRSTPMAKLLEGLTPAAAPTTPSFPRMERCKTSARWEVLPAKRRDQQLWPSCGRSRQQQRPRTRLPL